MPYTTNSKKIWDRMTTKYWQENLSLPWQPSLRDLENCRQCIKESETKVKNILILGATPEFRDLVAQFKARIWLLDQSLNMLKEMSKLTSLANPKKEKWLIGDWCAFNRSPKVRFDIVLGDLVLRLINPGKQLLFLEQVYRVMSPDGYFITRIHFINKSLLKLSCEEIINDVFSLSTAGKGTYIKNLIISRLSDRSYLFENLDEFRKLIHLEIENYLMTVSVSSNQKRILKGVLRRFRKKMFPTFFSQTKEEIKYNLNKFFIIKQRLIANDHGDAKYFPIYILKPRSGCKIFIK